jgi:hypothetical protein
VIFLPDKLAIFFAEPVHAEPPESVFNKSIALRAMEGKIQVLKSKFQIPNKNSRTKFQKIRNEQTAISGQHSAMRKDGKGLDSRFHGNDNGGRFSPLP